MRFEQLSILVGHRQEEWQLSGGGRGEILKRPGAEAWDRRYARHVMSHRHSVLLEVHHQEG